MDKKQFSLLIVLVIVSGFIGGMVSGRVGSVQAQDKPQDIIRAETIVANSIFVRDQIAFPDTKDKIRLILQIGESGNPGIFFYDTNQKARTRITLNESGKASVSLLDQNENYRAILGTVPTISKSFGTRFLHPESTLTLFDGKGAILFQAPQLASDNNLPY